MNDKTSTQLICLQALGLLSLVFGRVPTVAKAVAFLSDIVVNKWDQIWDIGQKTPKPQEGHEVAAQGSMVVSAATDPLVAGLGDAVAKYNGWIK